MAKILIIDDDVKNLKLLHKYLVVKGHETIELSDGRYCIEKINTEQPDIVITDIYMPEVDGVEVLTKIRSVHPQLPVIVVSAGTTKGDKTILSIMTEFGANACLAKPIDLARLLNIIDDLLNS